MFIMESHVQSIRTLQYCLVNYIILKVYCLIDFMIPKFVYYICEKIRHISLCEYCNAWHIQ